MILTFKHLLTHYNQHTSQHNTYSIHIDTRRNTLIKPGIILFDYHNCNLEAYVSQSNTTHKLMGKTIITQIPDTPIRNNSDSTTENYSQERGDIGIRGFWAKQFDCIVDIRITYPESNSNRNSTVEKLIEKQENEKKQFSVVESELLRIGGYYINLLLIVIIINNYQYLIF